ncbi:MAG: hypothetical protein Q9167_000195 [Letrouitia subvulpina]
MYARGILFGKMKYELGDHSFVRCPENNLLADIEFKTKGYFGGTYNAIGGVIKNEKSGEILYELSGMWSGEMVAKDVMSGKKMVLFDATNARHTPALVRPLEEQDERESQKLWQKTVVAIKDQDHDAATEEKSKIEDQQREEAARRQREGIDWQPRLFRRINGGLGGSKDGVEELDWILDASIDGPTPEAKEQQILAIAPILPGQKSQNHFNMTPSEPQPSQTANFGRSSDLIDFGQSEAPPVPTSNNAQHEFFARPPQGLQEPLEPGHPVKRVDTLTNDLDEFVDAKP